MFFLTDWGRTPKTKDKHAAGLRRPPRSCFFLAQEVLVPSADACFWKICSLSLGGRYIISKDYATSSTKQHNQPRTIQKTSRSQQNQPRTITTQQNHHALFSFGYRFDSPSNHGLCSAKAESLGSRIAKFSFGIRIYLLIYLVLLKAFFGFGPYLQFFWGICVFFFYRFI